MKREWGEAYFEALSSWILFFGRGMLINKLVYERWQGSKSTAEFFFFVFEIALNKKTSRANRACKFLLTLTTESANKITRHVTLETFFENKSPARASPLLTARLTEKSFLASHKMHVLKCYIYLDLK